MSKYNRISLVAFSFVLLFGSLHSQSEFLQEKEIRILENNKRYGKIILSAIRKNYNDIFVKVRFDDSKYYNPNKIEELCNKAGLILYKYELKSKYRLFAPSTSMNWAIITKPSYLEIYNRYQKKRNGFYLYSPVKYMSENEMNVLKKNSKYGVKIFNALMNTENKRFFTKVNFKNNYTNPEEVSKLLYEAGLEIVKHESSHYFRFGVTMNSLDWVLISTPERHNKYEKYVSLMEQKEDNSGIRKLFGAALFFTVAALTVDKVKDIVKSVKDEPQLDYKILRGEPNVYPYKYQKTDYRGPQIFITDGGNTITSANVCEETYSVIYSDKYGDTDVINDPFSDSIYDSDINMENYPITVLINYEKECRSGELIQIEILFSEPGEYEIDLMHSN